MLDNKNHIYIVDTKSVLHHGPEQDKNVVDGNINNEYHQSSKAKVRTV